MEKISLKYGLDTINIAINRKQVKNITLRVMHDSTVIVTVSENIEYEFIEDFCSKKTHWIFKQLNKFKRYNADPVNIEFVSGETVRYLGKQYRLKIVAADFDEVKWFRGYIYIYSKRSENMSYKQRQYEIWLKERIKSVSEHILDLSYEKLSRFNIKKPALKFRKMKSRWGSYLPDNVTITLNTELIRTPKHCIEYVIMHELIHLIHPDHSREFYNTLTIQLPDWKERKRILDEEFGINFQNLDIE